MRCVIVAGADIKNYEYIINKLDENDYFIYCDSGLKHLDKLKYKPNLIIGDFDSYQKPNTDDEIIVLPKEKDDTDSIYAVKEALKRGFDDFVLIGFIGNRIDHSLANISCLEMIDDQNANAVIIDDYSEMELVKNQPKIISSKFKYFSLMNIYGEVDGVNIIGSKYDLLDAKIETNYQYAISNEVQNDYATVYVKKGKLLLIKILEL